MLTLQRSLVFQNSKPKPEDQGTNQEQTQPTTPQLSVQELALSTLAFQIPTPPTKQLRTVCLVHTYQVFEESLEKVSTS